MSVAAAHLLCGMTDELVNQSLVDVLASEIANEAVTKSVPALNDRPLRIH